MQTNFFTGLGDDFFAGQRAAAALDEVQVAGGFVGAVHVHGQRAHLVQVKHGNAVGAQSRGAGFGTGHAAVNFALDAGQPVNEKIRGGAGADADHVAHFNVGERGFGSRLFHLLGVRLLVAHGFSSGFCAVKTETPRVR